MSPVSSSKVSAPAVARVQVPFTLSDTATCSGALYWANHPTSRSPWATGSVSVTVIAGTRDPVENAVPWTNVALATAVRDARYGCRVLWRSPSYALVVILTIALGIGINVTMFSVIHAVLWRSLPYPDARRIVAIEVDTRSMPSAYAATGDVLDLRQPGPVVP